MPKNLWKPKTSPFWYWEVTWKGHRFYGPTGETSLRRAEAVKDAEILKIKTGTADLDPIAQAALALPGPGAGGGSAQRRPRLASLDVAAMDYWEKTGQFAEGAAADEENLDWLVRTLGPDLGMHDIEEPELMDALARRRAIGNRRRKVHTPLSNATLNRVVTELFKRIHSHARVKMKVQVCEIDWSVLKLAEADELVRELSDEQERRLFEALRPDLTPITRFALATGLRRDNVIHLTRFQCDLAEGFIRLQVKSKKPGGKRLTIPISPTIVALLANEMARHDHPTVFTYQPHNRHGVPIEGADPQPMTKHVLENQFARALATAGIENFRWHDLRHTFASRFTRKKGLRAAQQQLGHSDPKTTAKYAHVSEAEIRDGLHEMDADTNARMTGHPSEAGESQNSPKPQSAGFTKRKI